MIQYKRVYDAIEDTDGHRVLVDRIWPRNLRKEALDGQWLREVAPTTELRRAYHRGEINYAQFSNCYQRELAARPACWWPLLDLAAAGTLTLLYAAKDVERNNARVLAEWLEDELERRGPASSPVCYAQ
ncbi:DUF488 family protein [Pseudomonas capeferrum]|uniref:DUF488 domain-containing protein n=1 Tax=Pseudomonas capeferrum TaxID=1495066 RepID=UPI0015E4238D|nr:DUF488 family protein [Pseudomonas capeferrum]MBA1201234.1 DUF488 family protein [Pseudomonas capeferrum]